MLKLEELPPDVLSRILLHSIIDSPSRIQLLTQFGRIISHSTRSALLHSLALQDDDETLFTAEDTLEEPKNKLEAVSKSMHNSTFVKHLSITATPSRKGEPIAQESLFLLLSKLPNLTHFEWKTSRLPPSQLGTALGTATKSLQSFRLSLPFQSSSSVRWDANDIASLPATIINLDISHLSLEGSRRLAEAIKSEAFPSLRKLSLSKTMFVDDTFLDALGQGARKLRSLVVKDMQGTKLTEKGLASLFEGCDRLENLVLDSIEGRLPKSTWSRLTPPDSLKSISILYSETGSHKSWVLDHLSSLPSLLSWENLNSFTFSRTPPRSALKYGQHQSSRHPIPELLQPKQVPKTVLDALHENGARLYRLDVDFWPLEEEKFAKLLERLPNAVCVKVMLDAPFKSILNHSSSFAAATSLREIEFSIPPQHSPDFSLSLPPLSPPTSPESSFRTLASSPPGGGIINLPLSPTTSPSSTSGSLPLTVVPNAKEWKKFLRKAHSLEKVSWIGRGGIGNWRVKGKGLSRTAEFEPLNSIEEVVEEEESHYENQEGPAWTSEQIGRRRASTVSSLAGSCLEGLGLSLGASAVALASDFVPDDEVHAGGGGGGQEREREGKRLRATSSPGVKKVSLVGVDPTPISTTSSGGGKGHSRSTSNAARRASTSTSSTSTTTSSSGGGSNGVNHNDINSFPPLSPSSSRSRSPTISRSPGSPSSTTTMTSEKRSFSSSSSGGIVSSRGGKGRRKSVGGELEAVKENKGNEGTGGGGAGGGRGKRLSFGGALGGGGGKNKK